MKSKQIFADLILKRKEKSRVFAHPPPFPEPDHPPSPITFLPVCPRVSIASLFQAPMSIVLTIDGERYDVADFVPNHPGEGHTHPPTSTNRGGGRDWGISTRPRGPLEPDTPLPGGQEMPEQRTHPPTSIPQSALVPSSPDHSALREVFLGYKITFTPLY